MSRLSEVIKNKNRVERMNKQKRNEEITNMRAETMYRVRLNDKFKMISTLLEDENISKVVIGIPQNQLSLFLKAVFNEEMMEYNITQINDNMFEISRKVINF